jgi:feruloyl esterase
MGGEAITNYPEDYDGVLLGQSRVSPRPNSALGMMKFIQAIQEMNREPGAWLSPAKLEMVDARVTAACDMTDGARDGVVWDHRLCHYDVGQLRCVSGDKPDCLTEPQIRSIKAILAGPHGPDGALLDTPMPITNMSVWSMFLGATPPPWSPNETDMRKTAAAYPLANTHGRGMYGPSYDFLRDFSFSRQSDIDSWEANALKSGFWGSPDLTPFARTGGKAILWVGASDPCCSNVDMEAYVRKLGATMTPGRVAEFIQLYEIPGTGHCGGGTGPGDASDRLLDALVDWVENGKIPGPVTMHRGADRVQLQFAASGPSESGVLVPPPAEVSRDFLVCPYPTVSVFDRRKANVPGAVYDGANWSCRASRD